MDIFLNQKVTGHVGSTYTHILHKIPKSHGTIIDNLADYSEDKYKQISEDMRGLNEWQEAYLRVPQEFLNKFPNLSIEKANKHYNTYLKGLRKILLKRIPFISSNYIHVSLDKLWYSEFQYQNVKYYIWKEFKDLRPFFVEIPDKKGNGRKNGNPFEKNSEVLIVNQKLIDLLIDSAETEELVALYYGDLTEQSIDSIETVPIDIDSLNNFIKSTSIEMENAEGKHLMKLQQNLRQAKYVKIISTFFYDAYGQYVLPQIPAPSLYGRVYYKGINIQNMSKIVRQACLGEHYVYDLNAAVYAIRLMMAKKILKENDIDDFGYFTYTKEYLEWKNPLRKQLSKHIKKYSNPEKLVKEAITAIGFGARIGGGSWLVDGEWQTTSIEDIIMNKFDRQNFMNDPWLKQFVKEQQMMTQLIAKDFINSPGFVESVINIPNMFKNDRIRKSQVMSYVFQHTEKAIMDIITEDINVIARVHDSFITKKKLSNEQMVNIRMKLNNIEPLMTINCEEFHEWIDVDIIEDEKAHEQRIKNEEQKANEKSITDGFIKKVIKTPYIEYLHDGKAYDGKCWYEPDQELLED